MEYHQRLGDHRPQARINDLVVTERARREGVGTRLLSGAEMLARKRGCFRMALVTAEWREATIAFYAREGWDDYGRWFVKPLIEGVGPGGQPTDDNYRQQPSSARRTGVPAICTASSAAPLRRLSAQLNSVSASARSGTCRIRPTSATSRPAASSGLG